MVFLNLVCGDKSHFYSTPLLVTAPTASMIFDQVCSRIRKTFRKLARKMPGNSSGSAPENAPEGRPENRPENRKKSGKPPGKLSRTFPEEGPENPRPGPGQVGLTGNVSVSWVSRCQTGVDSYRGMRE